MIVNTIKLTIKTLALLLIATLTINSVSAQLHVVKPDGDVGIGTATPTEKLEVNGKILASGGQITIGVSNKTVNGVVSESSSLAIGKGRTVGGASVINLFVDPDATGADVIAGRFISNMGSKGAYSSFMHRGTGDFSLRTWNEGSHIRFHTLGKIDALFVDSNGNVGIGTSAPTADFEVNGVAKKTGGGEFVTTSDKRTKKNINAYNAGLEEVLKINPVTFNYNGKAGISDTESTYIGLIAQEFAEIEPDAVKTFTHSEEGSNKTEDYFSMDASSVKYMLVNAVKEQQALIEMQKTELETLKETVAKLAENSVSNTTTGATEISVLLEGTGTEKALLTQNSPNPFTTTTRIEYFIPTDSRHCRMSFRDMNGKEIKQVNIDHDGIGAIELSAKDLTVGIYSYVLYVNGDIVDSKKMIFRQ